ncbi:peroxisomal membrane protein PMP34 [Chrysoperla carnea]|uniref:peroxisomal membrane protein PMP34 n=1 Tax=Chrysoperla carnea TaxID=189513 RepID=UPI001D07D068|nr:peroxisomal membrane protein PMP34 [Chrysoperla carnea]
MSNTNKLLSYETWVHAVSGATGSVIAMATFYPLDTVRQRLQLSSTDQKAESTIKEMQKLIANEGVRTLYQGMSPVLQSLCASNFIYFYTFHGLKRMLGTESTAIKDLLVGSVAGIINVLVTSPLWVVNTRLKSSPQPFRTLTEGLVYIGKNEGRSGLWAGLLPSLLLVSNPAIQFMTYETVKRKLNAAYGDMPAITYFLVGALAKAVATVTTYPLQLAQTRLRHGGNTAKKTNMITLIYNILKTNGIIGLYKGLEAKLLQTILTAALMFAAYEKIAIFVLTILRAKIKQHK